MYCTLNSSEKGQSACICVFIAQVRYVLLCVNACAQVCVLILASWRTAWWRAITFLLVQLQCSGCGTQLPSLPEHRWNRTQKTPLLPYTSVPPSLPRHPSLPPLDLCLRPSVCYFIFLSLDSLRSTLLKNCKLWSDVYSSAAALWVKRGILETASASISCCTYLSFTSAQTSCCLLEHFKS